MISNVFRIKRQSSLPFYCNPLLLFLFIWLIMLGSLWFKITEVSYPNFSLPVLIFAASFLSFLFGYYLVRTVYWRQVNMHAFAGYQIDISRLRRFNLVLACAALMLIAYNYAIAGLPPFFALFGFSTESVNGYGKLKQLLGPMLMVLFVDAFLDSSVRRRALYALFAFLAMLSYVARGGILFMFFEVLIVLSIRASISKRKIYLAALVGVVVSGIFFGVAGSYRTSDAILFAGMQIKKEFQQWPTIYIWVISYMSSALSNLCWFVDMAHFDHATWTFSYALLPSFWSPINPHADIMQSGKIIDGTSTYLANYFLDFSYFGIFLINLVIGMISGFGSVANRISRNFLVWSVFLSCIGFIFFWDFFATLSTAVMFVFQAMGQWYFVRELSPRSFNLPEKETAGPLTPRAETGP
jgi:oligosaccharide repeat unit polymerase